MTIFVTEKLADSEITAEQIRELVDDEIGSLAADVGDLSLSDGAVLLETVKWLIFWPELRKFGIAESHEASPQFIRVLCVGTGVSGADADDFVADLERDESGELVNADAYDEAIRKEFSRRVEERDQLEVEVFYSVSGQHESLSWEDDWETVALETVKASLARLEEEELEEEEA